MGVVLGKSIYIYSGTTGTTPVIAMAKSCVVHSRCELIERSSASDATNKHFLPGRGEWDISLNHLVSSDAPVEGLLMKGSIYTLRVVIGTTTLQGTAICEDATVNGVTGNLGTGTVKFKGSGALATPSVST